MRKCWNLNIKRRPEKAGVDSSILSLGTTLALLLLILPVLTLPLLAASPTPDELEMARLQGAAEESLANNDPSGAALLSGRAALMASQLAARQTDAREHALLQGRETLFRAQELLYRGLAMYKLGGGRPPASAGVCSMIEQGSGMADGAIKAVRDQWGMDSAGLELLARVRELDALAADLRTNAKAIRYDVQCP